jgi:hypothetical protein
VADNFRKRSYTPKENYDALNEMNQEAWDRIDGIMRLMTRQMECRETMTEADRMVAESRAKISKFLAERRYLYDKAINAHPF